MKTLGVCGCSWMAATKNGEREDLKDSEGKHFTEILAKKLNYNYKTYARGSSSNSCIRLQISQMIKENVDFLIIGTTSSNRIELPIKGKTFELSKGVFNINYSIHPDLSSDDNRFTENNLLSETISNFICNDPNIFSRYNLNVENLNAIKFYFEHMFDFNWRDQQDYWIIDSGLKELQETGIKFIFFPSGLFNKFKNFFSLDDKRYIWDNDLLPWSWEKGNRRWHTTDYAQEQGAEKILDYIIKNNLI